MHEAEDKDDIKWEGAMGNKSGLITQVCVCVCVCVSIVRGGSENGLRGKEAQQLHH